MPRFNFDLQRVLDIRATQEKLKQNELAMEMKKEHEIIAKIERLRKAQSEEYLHGQTLLTSSLADIRLFVANQRYMEALERTLARTHANLDGQREAVGTARKALIEAARKRKLLEKLKGRRFVAFKKEEETAEQKIIDEIGGTFSARFIAPDGDREAGGRRDDA